MNLEKALSIIVFAMVMRPSIGGQWGHEPARVTYDGNPAD